MSIRKPEIREFIVHNVDQHPRDIAHVTGQAFRISRQAVNRYLQELIADGMIEARGQTRSRTYALKMRQAEYTFEISATLQEDKVWRESVKPALEKTPENVLRICHYGFTEIMNNAIEHSEGQRVVVATGIDAAHIRLSISDNGVGIFNKLKRDLQLDDERHALLELTKGKLTTDPARHTGEGIFFTSRAFDEFSILSGDLRFKHMLQTGDWLLEAHQHYAGTTVEMMISPSASRTLQEVFDHYASDHEDYGFTKTAVPVSLVGYDDENLVSRSQARRLLARFDRFKEVALDFTGVAMLGQAFADEIFRVYRREHPNINISWVNATDEVRKMIRRAETQVS